jgi:hypothetical protein
MTDKKNLHPVFHVSKCSSVLTKILKMEDVYINSNNVCITCTINLCISICPQLKNVLYKTTLQATCNKHNHPLHTKKFSVCDHYTK